MDMPAKAAMLGIAGCNGFHSCTRCTIRGQRKKRRNCFPNDDENLPFQRTNASFRDDCDANFQKHFTILEEIEYLDMVKSILLDPMHLIFLGVVRRILFLVYKDMVKQRFYLSSAEREAISDVIDNVIKPITPAEFSRKPRSLCYVKR